jgi:hypothetical protein
MSLPDQLSGVQMSVTKFKQLQQQQQEWLAFFVVITAESLRVILLWLRAVSKWTFAIMHTECPGHGASTEVCFLHFASSRVAQRSPDVSHQI